MNTLLLTARVSGNTKGRIYWKYLAFKGLLLLVKFECQTRLQEGKAT